MGSHPGGKNSQGTSAGSCAEALTTSMGYSRCGSDWVKADMGLPGGCCVGVGGHPCTAAHSCELLVASWSQAGLLSPFILRTEIIFPSLSTVSTSATQLFVHTASVYQILFSFT